MVKKLAFPMLLLTIVLMFNGCQDAMISDPQPLATDELVESGTPIEGQYIVVLDRDQLIAGVRGKTTIAAKTEETIQQITSAYHIADEAVLQKYFRSVQGYAATLSKEQLSLLEQDKRVKYIEQDRVISLGKPPWAGGGGGGSNGQITPWGITRIGGPTDGTGKTAWIIDTGIDLDHPDLNVDQSRSVTFFTKGKDASSPDDLNGHGTHVAGTIAAIDNSIDVVGVAAGATVIAVKVLDRRGSGAYSTVIAGVDYVAQNASQGDVANMSLGGPVSNALDDAVLNAANAGVFFALAAGNEGSDANNSSPARVEHARVFTVSAFDNADNFASFSNWSNPPIDFSAPGVSILSLYKGGGTNTLNGTSMASPHVAGLLLVTNGNPRSDGFVNGDPDGNPDPIAHN